jgi:hypothetical protein
MLGISLVPDSKYPENASVIFLPTQAAADTLVADKVIKSIKEGKKIVMTTGFIANVKNGEQLAKLAGIEYPLISEKISTQLILNFDTTDSIKFPLTTDYHIVSTDANILLLTDGVKNTPFLVQNTGQNISVLNTHTFSQADFDAVGEVLLSPRQLGLLELPEIWVNKIRSAFQSENEPDLKAVSRVTFQKLGDGSFVVHNYNQESTKIVIGNPKGVQYSDEFTGKSISGTDNEISLNMAPRSRVWFMPESAIKN